MTADGDDGLGDGVGDVEVEDGGVTTEFEVSGAYPCYGSDERTSVGDL